jgi:hypothetical protein
LSTTIVDKTNPTLIAIESLKPGAFFKFSNDNRLFRKCDCRQLTDDVRRAVNDATFIQLVETGAMMHAKAQAQVFEVVVETAVVIKSIAS